MNINFTETANFIWSIADLLRGDYKRSDYGKVILPMTVLRRLDCVLADTKEQVLAYLPRLESSKIQNIDPILNKVAGLNFHNRSKYDFDKLPADQLFFDQIEEELVQDETLIKQAQTNTKENFKYGFEDKFMDVVIERMEQNEELFARLMDDEKMAGMVKEILLDRVFGRLRGRA